MLWIKTSSGSLVNLAQVRSIDVYERKEGWCVIAVGNPPWQTSPVSGECLYCYFAPATDKEARSASELRARAYLAILWGRLGDAKSAWTVIHDISEAEVVARMGYGKP